MMKGGGGTEEETCTDDTADGDHGHVTRKEDMFELLAFALVESIGVTAADTVLKRSDVVASLVERARLFLLLGERVRLCHCEQRGYVEIN